MLVLSLLDCPIEVQVRSDTLVSSIVTPASTSLQTYLQAIQAKDSRQVPFIPYSPFPFTMVNQFDYYEKDRPENQNHIYIRLRSKISGIWGNWLRIPDIYYGQEYRLCRIHIPIDNENNYNYCYLVNRYNDEKKVNYIELVPSIIMINHTNEELFYKYYINEGLLHDGEINTTCIDYNYLLNNNINTYFSIRPNNVPFSECSKLDIGNGMKLIMKSNE